jgi:hypothetical protein
VVQIREVPAVDWVTSHTCTRGARQSATEVRDVAVAVVGEEELEDSRPGEDCKGLQYASKVSHGEQGLRKGSEGKLGKWKAGTCSLGDCFDGKDFVQACKGDSPPQG